MILIGVHSPTEPKQSSQQILHSMADKVTVSLNQVHNILQLDAAILLFFIWPLF